MKKLTDEEVDNLHNQGHGFTSFMGGISGDKDKTMIYFISDGAYLPETPEEEKELNKIQEKEGIDYIESLT